MSVKEFEQARWEAVERALSILDTPSADVPRFFDVDVVRKSQQVLDDEGLTTQDVINDPTLLLRGDAYAGGSTTAMDPFHPATLPLIEMRFAAGDAVETRNVEGLAAAVIRAAGCLHAHGVPSEIAQVSTVGSNNFWFEPVRVFALMPDCVPSEVAPQLRMTPLSATYLIMGALAGIPSDHPARPAIREYVSMVSIPGLQPLLEPFRNAVSTALLGEEPAPPNVR